MSAREGCNTVLHVTQFSVYKREVYYRVLHVLQERGVLAPWDNRDCPLLPGRVLRGPFRTKISTPKKEGGISQNTPVVNSVRKSHNIRS